MSHSIARLTEKNRAGLRGLQERIGYRFADATLLQRAMVHSSYAFERMGGENNNETLEFLGDAVLALTLSYVLITRFPRMGEGQLTRMRAALVNETSLAVMAREIKLGGYLLLGRGEDSSRGREKSSILSCAYEALIGAMFLDSDSGYGVALAFVRRSFEPLLDSGKELLLLSDAKSGLQERLQERFNAAPEYLLDLEEGPPHARRFTVSACFRGKVLGTGQASSKKEAEQYAAAAALHHWDDLKIA